MDAVRKIEGWDGAAIMVHDRVVTLSGLVRRIIAIDNDGYARLEGEVSTRYAPHLTKLVEHEVYAADLTAGPPLTHPPITAEVMPEFLAGLSTKAKAMPKFQD